MFCAQCGQQVSLTDRFCNRCGSPLSQPSDNFNQRLVQALAVVPGTKVTTNQEADVVVRDTLVDADWKIGKKKVQYEALLKLDQASNTIIMWEILKEQNIGIGSFASFKVEKYSTSTTSRVGSQREVTLTSDGRTIDYTFEFGRIAKLVQEFAAMNNWRFKMVLSRKKVTG